MLVVFLLIFSVYLDTSLYLPVDMLLVPTTPPPITMVASSLRGPWPPRNIPRTLQEYVPGDKFDTCSLISLRLPVTLTSVNENKYSMLKFISSPGCLWAFKQRSVVFKVTDVWMTDFHHSLTFFPVCSLTMKSKTTANICWQTRRDREHYLTIDIHRFVNHIIYLHFLMSGYTFWFF